MTNIAKRFISELPRVRRNSVRSISRTNSFPDRLGVCSCCGQVDALTTNRYLDFDSAERRDFLKGLAYSRAGRRLIVEIPVPSSIPTLRRLSFDGIGRLQFEFYEQ